MIPFYYLCISFRSAMKLPILEIYIKLFITVTTFMIYIYGLPKSIQKSDTVYVSSSMFTNLDPIRLSTESQNAHVFHFNGANAARMLKKT